MKLSMIKNSSGDGMKKQLSMMISEHNPEEEAKLEEAN